MSNIEVVERLSKGLNNIDCSRVVNLVENFGLYGAARILGYDISHYNNLLMAGRLAIENLRNNSPKTLLEYADVMKERLNSKTYNFILNNHKQLQEAIDSNNHLDYDHDWFSANTMITMYSTSPDYGKDPVETPQYIWMRIAIQLYCDSDDSITKVIQTYDDMAKGFYTPASPTIFNAGMNEPQMASCFLLTIGDDLKSILKHGIYRGGMISKASGGLGFDVSRVRHSQIKSRGWSSGIIPMLQLYNSMVRYVDQCFTPETIVYTDSGPKHIEDIVAGDKVLTHDGTLDDVKYTMPHDYNANIVNIKVQHTFKDVKVSPVHPFLVIRNADSEEIKGKEPEWVDAAFLKETDLVAFPVPNYTRDLPDYTNEDMYMYGLMVGDGYVAKHNEECFIWLESTEKVKLVEHVKNYLALRNIKYIELSTGKQVRISWSGGSNFRFGRKTLYNDHGEKIIHPYYLHLPIEKSLALIAGLLDISGNIDTTWTINMKSELIAESIRYIMLRTGHLTSGEVIEINDETVYSITIPRIKELANHLDLELKNYDESMLYKRVVWSRVEKISGTQHYKGKIYDLEMSTNHNYLTHMGIAHNGGRRKGAATIFLRPHHIDIEDFIELPRKVGDKNSRAHDLNVCVWTSWIFWERVKNNENWTLFCPARVPQLNDIYGTKFTEEYIKAENDPSILPVYKKVIRAQVLFQKIIDIQRETGMPYLMNGDAANIKSNHRHNGYIRSSNLCVAPETPILTSKGYFEIKYLQDKQVEVWNGNKWSPVTIKQTAKNRHLITIYFNNGRSLTCTPDHKFIIGDGPLKEAKRLPAQYLYPGMKLREETLPVVNGDEPFLYPFLHGSLCAFGCFTNTGPIIDIMGPMLKEIQNNPDMLTLPDGSKTFPEDLPAPYYVPINSSLDAKLKWLQGFIETRSFVNKSGLVLSNVNETLMQDIQLMLTTLGAKSYIREIHNYRKIRNADKNILVYNTNLMIPWCELGSLVKLGLKGRCEGYDFSENSNDLELVVSEIVDVGRISDTYCFTEEHNNAGIFNGVLAGNCLEVIEFTDENTVAVCNLHSLSARMFGLGPIDRNNLKFDEALRQVVDFDHLSSISRRVIENLNNVIDHNWYPLDTVKNGVVVPKVINKSNKRHRPVGLGISGFAELLHILDLPFEDERVRLLNKMLFACMYWNALAQSIQLAINEGSYETFVGSPMSQGLLQFDLWKEEFAILGPNPARKAEDDEPLDPATWDQKEVNLYKGTTIEDTIKPTWDDIKRCILKYGIRNSLLIALMPTASTAQIRRNCESVEAHQNNLYSRKVLKASYPVLNRYLVSDLEKVNAWNSSTVEYMRVKNGSILGLGKYIKENRKMFMDFTEDYDRLAYIEKKYKTMWELPQKVFMNLVAERSRYIDQSSSTNVYLKDCTTDKLTASHLYANMLGLKTIMYYLRQTGGETIKFTADPGIINHIKGITVPIKAVKEKKKEVTVKEITLDKQEELASRTFAVNKTIKPKKFVCTDQICTSCT